MTLLRGVTGGLVLSVVEFLVPGLLSLALGVVGGNFLISFMGIFCDSCSGICLGLKEGTVFILGRITVEWLLTSSEFMREGGNFG